VLLERLELQVMLVLLVLRALLVSPGLSEVLAPQDPLDQLVPLDLLEITASPVHRDHQGLLGLLVLTGTRALKERQELLAQPDPWALRAAQDLRDNKDHRVLKDLKGSQDHRAHRGLRVIPELLELKDSKDHLDHLDLLVQAEELDLQDHLALLETKDPSASQDLMELRAALEAVALQARRVPLVDLDQQDHLVPSVYLE